MTGELVLVATPIGNLSDLSPAAEAALAGADMVACEDTRRTRQLFTSAGIAARPMMAVHDHNEASQARRVLDLLADGKTVAVVSDAGMPGISDPGERLVAAAAAAGMRVRVVPGPSAAVAALVVSGLPTGRFCFEGFLPRSGSGRRERVDALTLERRTTVLFEAPHRVRRTIAELGRVCGAERRVSIVRELTKVFEEVWRGTLAGAAGWLEEREPRGEYVVVLGGAPAPETPTEAEVEAALRAQMASGTAKKEAIASVAGALRVPKRQVYDLAVRID